MSEKEFPSVIASTTEKSGAPTDPVFTGKTAAEEGETRHWEDVVSDSFPEKGLQEHWFNKLRPLVKDGANPSGRLSNAEACRMVQEAILQRGKIVSAYTVHAEQESQGKEESSNVFQRLIETQTLDNEIGSGKVAKVYKVEGAQEFCVKVVWDQDAYKKENTVSQESYFLEELSRLTVAGVRTPRYVDFFSSLQMNAILMERIDGASLDKIMAGEADFPDDFSPEDFFGRLGKYLDALHTMNIFHMDIFPRNIMIEKKTGLPVVIDFGKSDHFDFSEEVGENKAETDRKGLHDAKKEVVGYLKTGVRKQLLAELDKRKKF